jgi:uncharacterized protein YqcC (DUF446 family)
MSSIYAEVIAQLVELENDLKYFGLWSLDTPSTEALASTQPFCIDTLSLPQWLQFVFLPRMYQLVDQQAPLPRQCGIAPMAEEYFKSINISAERIIERLQYVDVVLSKQ